MGWLRACLRTVVRWLARRKARHRRRALVVQGHQGTHEPGIVFDEWAPQGGGRESGSASEDDSEMAALRATHDVFVVDLGSDDDDDAPPRVRAAMAQEVGGRRGGSPGGLAGDRWRGGGSSAFVVVAAGSL